MEPLFQILSKCKLHDEEAYLKLIENHYPQLKGKSKKHNKEIKSRTKYHLTK